MARQSILKKEDREFAKAMAMLAKLAETEGITLDLGAIEEAKKEIQETKNQQQLHLNQHIEDAVLLSLHKPHAVVSKKCLNCDSFFATTYCYVSFCSHGCRIRHLASFGIVVDPRKPIWKGKFEEPLVIPPEVLQKMFEWATTILEQRAELERRHAPALESPPEQEAPSEEPSQESFASSQETLPKQDDALLASRPLGPRRLALRTLEF